MNQKKNGPAEQLLHLKLRDIKEFHGNPRKLKNPKFDEIYSSILAVGLEQPLIVTRRPGEDGYMLHSGGNTRLQAMKKIWHETKDPRFVTVPCYFRPWQGEHEVLASHILENEVRGSMNYLERTEAVVQLVENYLREVGELSLRAMADRLKTDGISVSATALHHMLECRRHILPALPTTLLQGLSRSEVMRLLAFRSEFSRVWKQVTGSDADFDDFWLMALSTHDRGLDTFNLEHIRTEVTNELALITPAIKYTISGSVGNFGMPEVRSNPLRPPLNLPEY